MRIYGIKTCGSVQKALAYFKARGIDYEFVDLKTDPVGRETLLAWLEKVPLKELFNAKGTKYRTLGLAALSLDDEAKIDWLARENLLIKRPVVETDDGRIVVAFDAARYDQIFGA